MAMEVDVRYSVLFGQGDGSDWIDYSVELTEEEEAFYNRTMRLRDDLNVVQELEPALQRAYKEIEQEEIDAAIDRDDDYVLECLGLVTVDPDDINDKVAARDPYTLQFFDLTELSDEELKAWDANDVEMPTIADFDESFEPISPYDQGWDLNVEFVNPWEEEELSE